MSKTELSLLIFIIVVILDIALFTIITGLIREANDMSVTIGLACIVAGVILNYFIIKKLFF